jgi:hypothetical protein
MAFDHSTDGTNDELCFAVPIIPSDIHVIKDHVNPLGILMRKHSLECFYSSGDRGYPSLLSIFPSLLFAEHHALAEIVREPWVALNEEPIYDPAIAQAPRLFAH